MTVPPQPGLRAADALLAKASAESVLDGLDARTQGALLDGSGSRADAERLLRAHAAEALVAERLVARLGGEGLAAGLGPDDPAARLLRRVPTRLRRRGLAAVDSALATCEAVPTGPLFTRSFSARGQKRRGGVYTEPALVDGLLDLVGWEGRGSFLEPAAGAGAFLVRAWERALEAGHSPEELAQGLAGVDLHPYACRAARTALALAACARGLEEVPLPGVTQADALAGPKSAPSEREGAWDFVLGNPPWVRGERIPADLRDAYKRRLGHSGPGNVDLASYFLLRALRWLRPGGRLGYVIPQGLLESRSAAGLRTLLAECTIEAVASLEWAPPQFAAATVIPCLLVLKNAPAPAGHRVALGRAASTHGAGLDLRWTRVRQDSWLDLCRGPWPLLLERGDLGPLRRLARAPTPLKAGYGLAVRTSARPGDLIANGPPPAHFEHPRRLLDGREVRAWAIDYTGRWIDYRREQISDPKTEAFFAGPKVVVPRIALVPQAAVDDGDEPFFARNTVMVVRTPEAHLDPHAVAALINSLPVRAYALHLLRAGVLAGSHRCTFYAGVIDAFPVPARLLDEPSLVRRLARLARRAREQAQAGHHGALIRVEAQVDALVAEAFGLTASQREALCRNAERDPLRTLLNPVQAGEPTRKIGVAEYESGRRYA